MELIKQVFIIFSLLIVGLPLIAQQQEAPYTFADHDRLIQVEANVNGMSNEMDAKFETLLQQFDNIEKRLDDIQTLLYWGFGILFSLMIFMLGFIIWDRRTTLAPVKLDLQVLKKENEMMKEIFRKQSESQPQLREILRNAGIF